MVEKIKRKEEQLPAQIVLRLRKVFPDFNPEELKSGDLEIWEAVQSKTATKEQYEDYRRSLMQELGPSVRTPESSRLQFCDFLGDRVQEIIYGMELFRKEISDIVSAEAERLVETGHFLKSDGSFNRNQDFRVEDLTEEDRQIWQKLEEGTITREDMETYRKKLTEVRQKDPVVWKSRNIFCAFIANKATPVIIRREIKKQS